MTIGQWRRQVIALYEEADHTRRFDSFLTNADAPRVGDLIAMRDGEARRVVAVVWDYYSGQDDGLPHCNLYLGPEE